MINQKLIHLFSQLAEYLEMDDVPFKPRAYQRVVLILENLEEDLIDVYRSGGREALKKIPGIGEGLAEKIEEFIKTGKMKELEALKKKVPVDLAALSRLEGLGPKTIKVLYKKLGVKNLTDLERAAKTGQIKKLEHFGQKSEENILSAIEFSKRDQGRFLLGFLLPKIDLTFSRDNVKPVASASEIPAGTSNLSRILPFTCTTIVIEFSIINFGSYFGQGCWMEKPFLPSVALAEEGPPRVDHSSSEKCGASGPINSAKVFPVSTENDSSFSKRFKSRYLERCSFKIGRSRLAYSGKSGRRVDGTGNGGS